MGHNRSMNVLLAPDSFKGSLSAAQVAAALAEGIREAMPQAQIVHLPIADGGEGTVTAVLASSHAWEPVTTCVTGPWGEPQSATWAWDRRGRRAVLELAAASGLTLWSAESDARSHPGGEAALTASTVGTGQLLAAALDAGCTELTLAVGGSATSDGGAGILHALGARLLDHLGDPVGPGAQGLADLASIDLSGLDQRVATSDFILASDVDNPLLGVRGAARVFAQQKGAGPADIDRIEAALRRWADLLDAALSTSHPATPTQSRPGPGVRANQPTQPVPAHELLRDEHASWRDHPGAGAAGGAGYAALAALGAVRHSGIEMMLDLSGFNEHLQQADLVVTGEGRLDEQSLAGKAPMGVLQRVREVAPDIPVIAAVGQNLLTEHQAREAGYAAVHTLTEVEPDVRRCQEQAYPVLRELGQRIAAACPHGAHAAVDSTGRGRDMT